MKADSQSIDFMMDKDPINHKIVDPNLLVVEADLAIAELHLLIQTQNIHYILVVNSGTILGMLTSQELNEIANHQHGSQTAVSEFIQHPIKSISESRLQRFLKVLLLFKPYWSGHLSIVDQQGNIVGVITPENMRQTFQKFLGISLESLQDLSLSQSIDSPERFQATQQPEANPHPASSHSTPADYSVQEWITKRDQVPLVAESLAQKTAECRYLQRDVEQKSSDVVQLQAQIQWQTETNQLLSAIGTAIDQSIALKDVFDLVVSQARALFHSDRVCIYQFQTDMQALVLSESLNQDFPSILGYLIGNEAMLSQQWLSHYQQRNICNISNIANIVDQAWMQAHPELLEKSDHWRDRSIHLLQFFQIQAKLAVPIFHHQTLWGLMVMHQCSGPRQWQASEIETLKLIALQLGIAIEQISLQQKIQTLQARLENQRHEQITHLTQTIDFEETLKQITDRVRNSLDEDQILQTAIQELSTVLDVHYCQSVLCASALEGNCGIAHEHTVQSSPAPSAEDSISGFPELCHQLRRGETCQLCTANPLLNRGKNAVLVCPVFDNQGCLGSLRLYRQRNREFAEHEIRLVQQVASHCAIAIRQARLYQASQTHVQELEQLHQLKDDFLSTVSHELRTPLSSIKMVTNLLKLAFDQLDTARKSQLMSTAETSGKKVAQYLKVLEDECDREINLVNDLLATQHLNTGIHPLSPTTIVLQEWLPQITEIFQHRTRMHQQFLELSITDDLPPLVSDAFMLSRIVVELLNNACKYTPPSGHISLDVSAQATMTLLTVKNTGTNIAPEELERIFDPFYRIPHEDRWKRGGTGLGLSLIKKFVEYLGGTIRAETTLDCVQFIVALPQTPQP